MCKNPVDQKTAPVYCFSRRHENRHTNSNSKLHTSMTLSTKSKTELKAEAADAKILNEARESLTAIRAKQAELRTEELQIREYLANRFHDGEEGARTQTVGGVKFTVTRKLNRTIGRDEAERLTREHPELSLEVIRWNPELRTGEYKKHVAIVDEYITTKPAPPEVTFA